MAKSTKKNKGKKKLDYYDAFAAQADYAVKESALLLEITENFKVASDLDEYLRRAHEIEQAADSVCHDVYDAILPDFVTPIDREDILQLTSCLDDLVDQIEEVIQEFFIYDIHFMHDDAKVFAGMVHDAAKAVKGAMDDFRDFKKSHKFQNNLDKVNKLEDDADQLYMATIRKLYTEDRENPMRVMVWTHIFDALEEAADDCESIADLMNFIMLKHG